MEYALAKGRFPKLLRADGVEHWLVPEPRCPRCCGPVGTGTGMGVALCGPCEQGAFEGSNLARVLAATLYLSPDSRFKWPHTKEIGELKATGARAVAYADVLGSRIGEESFDLVIPIPASGPAPRALAAALGERLGAPVEEALAFTRVVKKQKRLKREARFENVRGAMEMRSPLDDLRVLFVDDVAASCATLLEAARTAQAAGARECFAAVAARESNTYALERAGLITPS